MSWTQHLLQYYTHALISSLRLIRFHSQVVRKLEEGLSKFSAAAANGVKGSGGVMSAICLYAKGGMGKSCLGIDVATKMWDRGHCPGECLTHSDNDDHCCQVGRAHTPLPPPSHSSQAAP